MRPHLAALGEAAERWLASSPWQQAPSAPAPPSPPRVRCAVAGAPSQPRSAPPRPPLARTAPSCPPPAPGPQVRTLAAAFKGLGLPLHVLLLNAGVAFVPYQR